MPDDLMFRAVMAAYIDLGCTLEHEPERLRLHVTVPNELYANLITLRDGIGSATEPHYRAQAMSG
ncbi:MAG: hypothetical protein ACAH95_08460 [Fimbriimonas sp.]